MQVWDLKRQTPWNTCRLDADPNFGFEMTKSTGVGRGGARPGSGRKPKAITARARALKDALGALNCGSSNFGDADRRFVRAMIALGAPNSATAGAFGISEVELFAKFPDELASRASDLWPARAARTGEIEAFARLTSTFAPTRPEGPTPPRPDAPERRTSRVRSA